MDINKIVDILIDAEENCKEITKITDDEPELNHSNAYDVQHHLVEKKLADGAKVIGMKMGLTSRAKMEQMGISDPLYGHLFDYMQVENHGQVSMGDLIHPKVESEIAFIFSKDLSGNNLSDSEIVDALQYAVPVMELVDSRFKNFNFTLPDVIADNCSSSRYVVGDKMTDVKKLPFDQLNVSLSINGEVVDKGKGSAVLGHPFASIRELAKMLSRRGLTIPKGYIILTGGITKAYIIKSGDQVKTSVEKLGDVSFNVVE